jgi:exonuclease SbcC
MEIILKKLTLVNFKGIRSLEIDFNDEITNILGDNATGKTTVFDAFTWLFFGKESGDRKDFNIKNTVDRSLNRQEHEVAAVLLIDGIENTIRRIYKENWVKKTGSSTSEFSGNLTSYFWDGVPIKKAEDFNKRVSDILQESIFKLISNPMYFNGLKWQERRSVLENMAGTISNQDIAAGNKAYEELLANLTNGKTLEQYKLQIGAQKKGIKEVLDQIPTRIDELLKRMPEPVDAISINKQIEGYKGEILAIETEMADLSQSNQKGLSAITEHQNKIHAVKAKITDLRFSVEQQVRSTANDVLTERNVIARQISSKQSELEQIIRQNDRNTQEIDALEKRIVTLRADCENLLVKEIVFDEHAFTCPTCQRAYETDDIEEMKGKMVENFNLDKNNRVNTIRTEGKRLVEDQNRLKAISYDEDISILKSDLEALNSQLISFDDDHKSPATVEQLLTTTPDYAKYQADLKNLEDSMPEIAKVDLSDLQTKKSEINELINSLIRELANENVIKENNIRIEELKKEEQKLSAELASFEGTEFTITAFNKQRIETIESRVNGLFKIVKFKMFNEQINGGEAETCETMLGDVPFSDLNNAARINAGLDIINALCTYYNVHAPCFIDNAESITQLINVQSQIIRLVVSEPDKKLRVA